MQDGSSSSLMAAAYGAAQAAKSAAAPKAAPVGMGAQRPIGTPPKPVGPTAPSPSPAPPEAPRPQPGPARPTPPPLPDNGGNNPYVSPTVTGASIGATLAEIALIIAKTSCGTDEKIKEDDGKNWFQKALEALGIATLAATIGGLITSAASSIGSAVTGTFGGLVDLLKKLFSGEDIPGGTNNPNPTGKDGNKPDGNGGNKKEPNSTDKDGDKPDLTDKDNGAGRGDTPGDFNPGGSTDSNELLMRELEDSGVKYNPDKVVIITKTPDGKLMWLEIGDSKSGLKHIVDNHATNFADRGVKNIPEFLNDTLKTKPIKTGQGAKGPFADYSVGGVMYRVAYGTNGYIVSFYPIN